MDSERPSLHVVNAPVCDGLTVPVRFTGLELLMNSGRSPAVLADLIDARFTVARYTARRMIEERFGVKLPETP